MADAVALAPDSLQTRIPRGAILLGAARFVDDSIAKPMLDLALADYETVFEIQSPYLKNLGTHGEGELLGALADVYRRLGNIAKSREYLVRIVADLPGTPYEKQAKRCWPISQRSPVRRGFAWGAISKRRLVRRIDCAQQNRLCAARL